MRLLCAILAIHTVNASADTTIDLVEKANNTLERLDKAVQQNEETVLKQMLKQQASANVKLELENQELGDRIRELQQDISKIQHGQRDSKTQAEQAKTIRLLMEKQNEINALQKQIKQLEGGGGVSPPSPPVDSSLLQELKQSNQSLVERRDNLEEEVYTLKKKHDAEIQKLKAFYEQQYLETLKNPAVSVRSRGNERAALEPVPKLSPETDDSLLKTLQAQGVTTGTKSQPMVKNEQKSKFDSLIKEAPLETPAPIQPVEEVSSASASPPASFKVFETHTNVTPSKATAGSATPASFAVFDAPKPPVKTTPPAHTPAPAPTTKPSTPASFAVFDAPKPPVKTTPPAHTPAPAPATKPTTPSSFSIFDEPKPPVKTTPPVHTPAPAPATKPTTPSSFSIFDEPKPPASSAPTTTTPPEPATVIATTLNFWESTSEYDSLLPTEEEPKPANRVDLFNYSRPKALSATGLSFYDIPLASDKIIQPENKVEAPRPSVLPEMQGSNASVTPVESNETAPTKPHALNTAGHGTEETSAPIETEEFTGGILQVEAQVDYLSGQSRPAHHTEFFITTLDLNDILINNPALKEELDKQMTGKNISSYAELWARAQKYGYNYPGLASKIRNVLKKAGKHRIRTDANGRAQLDLEAEAAKGQRYIVGVSPAGTVGVVWSKQFYVQDYAGKNKALVLGGKDAIWLQ